MSEEWVTHLAEGEDGPILALFNIGLASEIGDESKPVLVTMTLPFKDAGKGGMGDQRERSALAKSEDAYSDMLDSFDAVHFVTLRGFGTFAMMAYAPQKSVKSIISAAASAFPGYEVEAEAADDPEWQQYQDLFPDDIAIACHYDRILIKELEKQGDRIEKSRPVEHLVMLPDQDSVMKIEKVAAKAGYTIGHKGERNEESEFPYSILLIKEHAITLDDLGAVREELMNLAERFGGDYDGWQTPTVS